MKKFVIFLQCIAWFCYQIILVWKNIWNKFWPSFFPVLCMCLTFPSWKFLFISSIPKFHHDTLWGVFFFSSKHLMNFKCLEIMFFISILNFKKKFSVDIFSPTFFFSSFCSFTDSLIFLVFTTYFISNFGPIFGERYLQLYFPSLLQFILF